jgi:hypothetical protein
MFSIAWCFEVAPYASSVWRGGAVLESAAAARSGKPKVMHARLRTMMGLDAAAQADVAWARGAPWESEWGKANMAGFS